MLTPLDIHNKEFRKAFRGYDDQEVDSFLDEVVRDLEATLKERDQLKETVADLRRQLDQFRLIEDSLQKALVVAQQAADEVTEASGKEAEVILDKARQDAEKIREDALSKVREVEERAGRLRSELEVYRAKMRSLLEAQMELLGEMHRVGQEVTGVDADA